MNNKLNIYCLLLMLSCFGYAFGIADKINIFIIHIKRFGYAFGIAENLDINIEKL